jgi:hypothetical protein
MYIFGKNLQLAISVESPISPDAETVLFTETARFPQIEAHVYLGNESGSRFVAERKNRDGLNQVLKTPQGDWGPKEAAVQNSRDSALGLWPEIGRQAPAHELR